ncbi:MAG: DUF87 domain-containing protein [Clostridia bacterium]|nr:DUF87 domain-containing protein [Clostridia bacterium]
MGLIQQKREGMVTKVIIPNTCDADNICSSYISFENPKCVEIDGILYSSLIVTNYSREMEPLFLDKILSLDIDTNLSMFYMKQNTYDVIKELTYTIGHIGANIKTSGENEQGIEVAGTAYSDAKFIRKELQMGEEDFFYICILIGVYAKKEEQLEADLEKLESVCLSCGLSTIRANFRQEETFKMILPFNKEEESVSSISKRNVLTSGLTSTYPFVSNELFDKKGILIGVNTFDKSILMLDRFDTTKYKNSNMFVVGTSGSGKSYFVKLMINRNRFINISQFIIDPDREYKALCSSLKGTYINFGANQTINVFDIRECALEEGESFLLNKVSKLKIFFSMIFENMSKEDESVLEDIIIKCYEKYDINENNRSLYITNPKSKIIGQKIFKTSDMMPTLEDFNNLLKKEKKLKKYALELKPYISGTLKYLNSKTTIDANNELVVVDIHDIR